MEYIKGQEIPDFDTEKVNTYLDKMMPPQTITMTVEGVKAHFWVVTFMEVFADGSTITKYGMYSYN